jgi:TatD DNase family protein
MLIDTHAHVNFRAFKDDWRETIKRSLQNDTWVINVGSNLATSRRAVEIAGNYPDGVYAIVGIHPIHTSTRKVDPDELEGGAGFAAAGEDFNEKEFSKLAQNPKAVAIGETGLDYYRLENVGLPEDAKSRQIEIFKKQIEFALEAGKPVVLHCRQAYKELLSILKEYKNKNPKLCGVNHFFSGKFFEAQALWEMGFLVSFTGVITFARDYDKVIKAAPLAKLMVETDSPYVAPAPHRGKRNEPLYVRYVAEKIAEIKGLSFDEVARQTTENARKLFRFYY